MEGAGFEEEDGKKRLVCCWFWVSDRKGKELLGFFFVFLYIWIERGPMTVEIL